MKNPDGAEISTTDDTKGTDGSVRSTSFRGKHIRALRSIRWSKHSRHPRDRLFHQAVGLCPQKALQIPEKPQNPPICAHFRHSKRRFIRGERQFIDGERRFIDRERRFIDRGRRFIDRERRFIDGERRFIGEDRRFISDKRPVIDGPRPMIGDARPPASTRSDFPRQPCLLERLSHDSG